MKKFIAFIFVFFLFVCGNFESVYAENERTYFAKVQTNGVYFCSMPNEASALFEIPNSYFVEVESVVDDYYKIYYNGIAGYVKKEKVSLMDGIPQTPYATASFKSFIPYYLHESPTQSSPIVANISTDINLKFFGSKTGEQLTSTSNLWHYVSITQNEQTCFGYIFASLVDPSPQIIPNNETFNEIGEEVFDETLTEFTTLSTGTKVILIIAIGVLSS